MKIPKPERMVIAIPVFVWEEEEVKGAFDEAVPSDTAFEHRVGRNPAEITRYLSHSSDIILFKHEGRWYKMSALHDIGAAILKTLEEER